MTALVWDGPEQVRLNTVPKLVPREGEVLIKTKAVGVCGTDMEIFRGDFKKSIPPLIMGHEASGIVERTCGATSGFATGDRVVVDPGIGCGQFEFCRKGSYWQCDHRRMIGIIGHDGGFAEYFVAPEFNCHRIPDFMSWEEAGAVDIVADPVHAMQMLHHQLGETVAVFGPGPGGLVFVQLARAAGASWIVLIGTKDERLELGRSLGANEVINVRRENVGQRIRELTNGRGVDIAIEASGASQAVADAMRATRKQGQVMVFGVYSSEALIDMQDMHAREIRILGSSGCPWSMSTAVKLVASGAVRVKPMITHRVNLEGLERLFVDRVIEKRQGGYIKAVLLL